MPDQYPDAYDQRGAKCRNPREFCPEPYCWNRLPCIHHMNPQLQSAVKAVAKSFSVKAGGMPRAVKCESLDDLVRIMRG